MGIESSFFAKLRELARVQDVSPQGPRWLGVVAWYIDCFTIWYLVEQCRTPQVLLYVVPLLKTEGFKTHVAPLPETPGPVYQRESP